MIESNGTDALVARLRESGRSTRVTITRRVTKRCPYLDEVDVGRLTLIFENEEAPEMYALAERIDRLGASEPLTHEVYTATVQAMCPSARVSSTWETPPWTMTVECA